MCVRAHVRMHAHVRACVHVCTCVCPFVSMLQGGGLKTLEHGAEVEGVPRLAEYLPTMYYYPRFHPRNIN